MWRRFELLCGVGCCLLGLLPHFWRHGSHTFKLFTESPALLLDAVVLFFLPGLFVAFGSYLHALKGKTLGFVLLLIGGIFLTGMGLIHLVGGVFYVFGFGAGWIILTQSFLALMTVVLSLVVHTPPALHES